MKVERICNSRSYDVAPEQVDSVALNNAHKNVLLVQWLANDLNRILEYSGLTYIILDSLLDAQKITQNTVNYSNGLYADANVGSIPVAHLVAPVLKSDFYRDKCVFALLAYYIWKTERKNKHRLVTLRGMLEIVSTMKKLNKGWYCAKAFEKLVLWSIYSGEVYKIDLKRVDVDIFDEDGVYILRAVYKKTKYAIPFFFNGKFYDYPDCLKIAPIKYRSSTNRETAVDIYNHTDETFIIHYAPQIYHLVFCTVNPLLIFDCLGKSNGGSIFGIHHRDMHEKNNNINNLVFMNVSKHQKLHKNISDVVDEKKKKGITVTDELKCQICENCYNEMFYFDNCRTEWCHMRGV